MATHTDFRREIEAHVLWVDQLQQDLRYALRGFARTPGFTLIAVLTLGLAIGLNTAIFSVVDNVLRPLPFPHADRLVRLFESNTAQNRRRSGVSPDNLADWRRMSTSFDAIAAITSRPVNFAGVGDSEPIAAMMVSPEFFEIFGTPVAHGRPFEAADFTSNANAQFGVVAPPASGEAATVIISDGLWRRHFGGDPAAIGRRVDISGKPAVVVGVLQPVATFDETPSGVADCWIPMVDSALANHRRLRQLTAIGRLRVGISLESAEAELAAVATALAREHPQDNKGWTADMTSLHHSLVGDARAALLILLAGVACVLLIACANVANLFLMRGVARSRELAVRVALGAGPSRLMRQWLTESVVLAMAGGAAGLAIAYWAVPTLIVSAPQTLPRTTNIAIDTRILAFCVVISVITGMLCGLAPGVAARIGNAAASLRAMGAPAAPSWRWLRQSLVVAQVGLAIVLLVGAGLMLRTLMAVHALDLGFDPRNVLTFGVDLQDARSRSQDAGRTYSRQLVERLAAIPGVESAGVGGVPLLGGAGSGFRIAPDAPGVKASVDVASDGYFRALRLRLLEGRLFDDTDNDGAERVAIVNRAFANEAWGTEHVVGRRLLMNDLNIVVVGVLENVRTTGLEHDPVPAVYFPATQRQSIWFGNYVVRTTGEAAAMLPHVRDVVRSLGPGTAVTRIATMEERVARAMAARRFNSWLIGLYSIVALVLAVVGIYGLISEAVASRTAEIGVRMALGARRRQVVWVVAGRSLMLTAGGIALGLAAAAGVTRYLEGMLFGLTPLDPMTFSVAPIAFGIAALIAAIVPARRATTVDPVVALRSE